jgi:MoaA/NifB/PqqE/SkfB family radical SAM enzyme
MEYATEHLTLRLELTRACPLACAHCSVVAGPKRAEEMPTEQAIRITREFASLGGREVILTGGEPLIYSGLDTILETILSLGIAPSIFTMALGWGAQPITCERARKLAMYGPTVWVSLHGDSTTHDRLTGRVGSREATEEGVGTLLAAGVQVKATCVATPETITRLAEAAEACKRLGISELRVFVVVPQGRAKSHKRLELWDHHAIDDAIAAAAAVSGPVVRLGQSADATLRGRLLPATSDIVVNWDGWVSNTHAEEPAPSWHPFDNAFDHPLIDVLRRSPRLNSAA